MRTLGEIHRDEVRSICEEFLGERIISLTPREIMCVDKGKSNKTVVKFSFTDSTERKILKFSTCGHGFVNCIYSSCMDKYIEKYPSLQNLVLVSAESTPLLSTCKSKKIITKIGVNLKDKKEIVEFRYSSGSLLYSCLAVVLKAFQFYINCEKTFRRLKSLVSEARSRQRADLVSLYSYKMSSLTRVNNYALLEY